MSKELEQNNEEKWQDKAETVLAIVFVILLIGLIVYYLYDKYKSKKVPTPEELKQKELDEIQARIKVLEPQKEQLEKKEKKYFLFARLIIGFILFVVNGLYLYFDNWSDFSLGDQLNINAGIALVYSFVAFILYGTPSALVKAIKSRASKIFLRNHIHVLTELNELKIKEKEIELFLVEAKEAKKVESVSNKKIKEELTE